MSGIYSMSGPTYRGATREELFDAAMDQPLSRTSTYFDQTKGGILESYVLGTAIKEAQLPEAAPVVPGITADPGERDFLKSRRETPQELGARRQSIGAYDEDQYKASPYFRKDIPYDPGMTEARASALASMDDAKKVREHYAQKRPISAFIGNLAGQAFDPINYVPIAGPLVKAAAVAKAGRVGGGAIHAGLDAAANTAAFGIATSGERAKFGDDVSWQATVSQIATAALIGGAFGAIGGAVGSRVDARRVSEAESRLSTLRTTQEARIALNEGIDAIVRGEDIKLSPNATEPMARVADEITAYHGSPHDFTAFSTDKVGTGEGMASYGHGLYFAENEATARSYQEGLKSAGQPAPINVASKVMASSGEDVARSRLRQVFPEMDDAAIEQAISQAKALPEGQIYQVGIKADGNALLDWDKPLSEQSEAVRLAVAKAMRMPLPKDGSAPTFEGGIDPSPTGEQIYKAIGDQAYLSPDKVSQRLSEAGIPGIKYLDQVSRSAGEGTRNFVIFDDKNVRVTAKNGVAVDTTAARPDPLPDGLKQAEASIAKPDDSKALAAQYRVDPQTGSFHEEAEVAQLAAEGRLTETDVSTMAQAQSDFETGAAYAEALRSVAGCLI